MQGITPITIYTQNLIEAYKCMLFGVCVFYRGSVIARWEHLLKGIDVVIRLVVGLLHVSVRVGMYWLMIFEVPCWLLCKCAKLPPKAFQGVRIFRR